LAAGVASERAARTPSRQMDEIRARIQDGTYDSPEMAESVARRILESGDLTF